MASSRIYRRRAQFRQHARTAPGAWRYPSSLDARAFTDFLRADGRHSRDGKWTDGLIKGTRVQLPQPTAALDPKSADQIVRLTARIVSQHKLTTLMVTHSMPQAATLGDRIVMMNHGSVHADCAGAHRRHVRAEDLIRRFDEIRRDERLDVSAAELLRDAYV